MPRDARLQRLLLAWPLCGAAGGLFLYATYVTGAHQVFPILTTMGLIGLPLVVGTMACKGPSRASFWAGCQGMVVATLAMAGLVLAGLAFSLIAAVLLGQEAARGVALLAGCSAVLAIGVGAACTPIQRTTRRHIAAAVAGWIIGLFGAMAFFLLLLAVLPMEGTPGWLSAFALGSTFSIPTFTSIALFDRLATPTQR
jgi:hypothetical protein